MHSCLLVVALVVVQVRGTLDDVPHPSRAVALNVILYWQVLISYSYVRFTNLT